MPVYNGEMCIRDALESLLAQSFTDFELIISDNASTDSTEAICSEYSQQDHRIRYVRQPENFGAAANFNFVLDLSIGEYFMWAAADDKRSKDFLEENLAFLTENPDFVASTSPTCFDGASFDERSMGDFSLDHPDPFQRICDFFTLWHANSRFYSLIRRDVLISSPFKGDDYLGADWGLVIYLAVSGKLKRVPGGWVALGASGVSRKTNVFECYNKDLFAFLVPFNRLASNTLAIVSDAPIQKKAYLLVKLMIMNIRALKLNAKWLLAGRRI